MSGQNSSIRGNGIHLPWKEFSACFHGIYGSLLDSAAAGDFHAHDGHALNIVLADDLCKLLAVVYRIQFWTSDQGNLSLNEILVEICIGVGSTICCNEKVCSVKVRRIYRYKLNLYRPLLKLGFCRHITARLNACSHVFIRRKLLIGNRCILTAIAAAAKKGR